MSETITGTELTCQEVIDFLGAYLDGTLGPWETAVFNAHLAICPDCVNYLDSYRAAIRFAKDALPQNAAEVLPPVPEDLFKAILAARAKND